uniref:Uncharacterized protein n=1 Tax=viral metagenome TaxID=1070528 RepID=A0A6M3K2Z7_9ZZZZ
MEKEMINTKVLGLSKAKNMLKVFDEEAPKKETWYWLTPQVQQFIGDIKEGTEVEFEVNEKQGKKTIVFLKKKGVTASKPIASTAKVETKTETGFKCKDCGATLKDNSYETCYKCSMARREKEEKSPENKDKQSSIRAQAIGNMVSRTLISLQGQFDLNNVGEYIDTLYAHYNRNISKLEK